MIAHHSAQSQCRLLEIAERPNMDRAELENTVSRWCQSGRDKKRAQYGCGDLTQRAFDFHP
jgi:hypothetical protein